MTVFLDTNVLVYASSNDPRRERAKALLAVGGVISVQVLNEFANVLRKRLKQEWASIETALAHFRVLLDPVTPLTAATHDAAVALARDHSLSLGSNSLALVQGNAAPGLHCHLAVVSPA